MHQTHAIPWNTLASHFEFIGPNTALTKPNGRGEGAESGLFRRNDARQAKDLQHFARCLRQCIREFALTEVAKIEDANHCRGMGLPPKADLAAPLFDDSLLDLRHHPFHLGPYDTNNNDANQLMENHQLLSYWVERAGGVQGSYGTSEADLADSVKLLVQLGESEALLQLCRSPPHLRGIMSMGWGHSFEVNHIIYETLPRYLLMNLGYAVRQRVMSERMSAADRPIDPNTGLPRGLSPKKQFTSLYEITAMRKLVRESFTSYDYSTQFVMHRTFWQKYVELSNTDGDALARYVSPSLNERPSPMIEDPTVADPERTKQYLSDCFRSLYLVYMIMLEQKNYNEKELAAFWDEEIAYALIRVCPALKYDSFVVDEAAVDA